LVIPNFCLGFAWQSLSCSIWILFSVIVSKLEMLSYSVPCWYGYRIWLRSRDLITTQTSWLSASALTSPSVYSPPPSNKNKTLNQAWWLRLVILATWKTEMKRIAVWD
jgi:hypothetical protein